MTAVNWTTEYEGGNDSFDEPLVTDLINCINNNTEQCCDSFILIDGASIVVRIANKLVDAEIKRCLIYLYDSESSLISYACQQWDEPLPNQKCRDSCVEKVLNETARTSNLYNPKAMIVTHQLAPTYLAVGVLSHNNPEDPKRNLKIYICKILRVIDNMETLTIDRPITPLLHNSCTHCGDPYYYPTEVAVCCKCRLRESIFG
jgi:hypothetical protein